MYFENGGRTTKIPLNRTAPPCKTNFCQQCHQKEIYFFIKFAPLKKQAYSFAG